MGKQYLLDEEFFTRLDYIMSEEGIGKSARLAILKKLKFDNPKNTVDLDINDMEMVE